MEAGKARGPSPELKVSMVANVSTCHIPPGDAEILYDAANTGFLVWQGEEGEGWIVSLAIAHDEQMLMEELAAAGLSEAFGNLMRLAKDTGATLLRLDPHGDEIDGLTVYDW